MAEPGTGFSQKANVVAHAVAARFQGTIEKQDLHEDQFPSAKPVARRTDFILDSDAAIVTRDSVMMAAFRSEPARKPAEIVLQADALTSAYRLPYWR